MKHALLTISLLLSGACLISLFVCANLVAMQANDTALAEKKLTIIDLHQMDKIKFGQLNEDQKWKLLEDSRELIQKYALTVANQNIALVELRRLTGTVAIGVFLVNNHQQANPKSQEKN